jgi:uncharacterized membrane protein YcaP (DUF421 family)
VLFLAAGTGDVPWDILKTLGDLSDRGAMLFAIGLLVWILVAYARLQAKKEEAMSDKWEKLLEETNEVVTKNTEALIKSEVSIRELSQELRELGRDRPAPRQSRRSPTGS